MMSHKRWAVAAALLLPMALAGCVSGSDIMPKAAAYASTSGSRYDAVSDGDYTIAAVPARDLKTRYMRQLVDDPTGESVGTVVVDPKNRFLYLVQEGGKALRYGVGVGKAGMAWSGTAKVAIKREWPSWTPTRHMIAREPNKYVKWARGMDGGTQNPLGARALYLFRNGKDTLYRIHGTNEPWSIGQAMSSGCIRMMNQDVIDLYRRVPSGTKVVVLPAAVESAAARE
ncbi:L,D-transpeptidase [Bradyrhizobium japonicum]|uniref:L,D-transpeptidase n=1 Tax=Bradyrhizobium japonicum TaxID=375 RepID=UPI0032DF125C